MKLHLVPCVLVIGVSLLLSGCGGMATSLADSIPKKSIPDEFFYHTSGTCSAGTLNFVALVGGGIMLRIDPTNMIVGQGELYLSKDETFTLRYQEYTSDAKVFETKVSGKMEFDQITGLMTLENIGTGSVTTYNGRAVLEIQFTKAINEATLENQKAIFHIVRSMNGLDITAPDYCGN